MLDLFLWGHLSRVCDISCFFIICFLCRVWFPRWLPKWHYFYCIDISDQISSYFRITVKSRLSERRLSETTGLFEDDGQSRIFSLLSIAIKLPIIRISINPKKSFFRSDSLVPIEEVAIKLPFKIRSPNVTHGDHDFFVWSSSIYTPE